MAGENLTRATLQANYYDTEQYHNDPESPRKLLQRLEGAHMMATALAEEFTIIRNTANALGIPWSRSLESMIAHLSIDLNYLRAEIEDMRGS